ncbi:6-hydroxytryprostatin B O-methyltransferase [Triangularia setosa]|uniref:6-hydroxytryprostatin B O-methyltransferase n=1 Tax=Triangularia setosa TaxID=2587417 RepID=A0AAN6VZ22_9PEZI|nr:6-hydroxytryprostatin B O-methyltransferase [Podospora setosa]
MATNAVHATTRIIHLAQAISESVAKINEVLSIQGLPTPSFDEDFPANILPTEALDARDAVLDATAELHDLLLGPLHLVKMHAGSNNSVCMQAIARYGIANIVPPGGQSSFKEIGKQSGLGEQMVRRLLRHAMTMRIFCEPEPGVVAHTQASRMLASPQMRAWMTIGTGEMWPAATKLLDALEKWPGSQEPNETAFSLSQNTTQSIYEVVGSSPERGARFAQAMEIWATRPDYAPSHVVEGYVWESIPSSNPGGRIHLVDVGGAQGHVACALAKRYPSLEIVVQDMDKVIEGAELALPEDLARQKRIRFMAHDLFAPQTVAADAFFFRWILHNWADKYCVAILRAHVPALRPGARLIIMDTCMPEPGEDSLGTVPVWVERDLRAEDLNMATIFNARERTLGEWKALFAQADAGFKLEGVTKPKGSALTIMEVVWEP